MTRIIKQGQEAREALKRGIDLACDCAKVTLGANGRNVVLGRIDIPPTITNDGVSVVRNVEADDEIENQGVWIVKEACSVASNKAGDGTTTTAVLLQAIVSELFEQLKETDSFVSKKPNVMDLMRQVDLAKEETINALKKKVRKVAKKDIYNVAMTAGEFDWLAKIVTEIYEKIGKDGYITLKEGIKTEYETFKGIELNAGYQSEYFINTDNQECIIENPYILVTNQPLDATAVIEIIPTLISQESKGLILIAPDFSKDLINRLNKTKLGVGFNCLTLKLPTYDKDDLLVDIATLTKAKFLDKNLYTKTEDFIADIKIDNLGKVDKSISTDSKTVIIGGEGDTTERVSMIKQKIESTESMFDKDNLEKRVAYLSGGIATLTIGGDSDFEKMYFKLKAENAVNSVQNALKEGVVRGGGLTLKEIAEELPINILSQALQAPYKQLQLNSGGMTTPESVIDAVATVISSLESACSLAGRVLTTEVVIAFKNETTN